MLVWSLFPFYCNELIGRPLGSAQFTASVERRLRRSITPGRRCRKPKIAAGDDVY